VELRKALKCAVDKAKIDEAKKDAAVVVALVLYKTLINNAKAYGEWAGWYKWARGLVEKQEFVVTADKIRELREVQRRLEEAAEEVRRELNSVLALYALHSRDLYEKLKPHLEVDIKKAEELAEARSDELSRYSNTNMGTKVYAALLSIARGGIYGHAAMLLMGEGALEDSDVTARRPLTTRPIGSPRGAARLWTRRMWGRRAGRIGPPLRFCGTYWAEPLVRTSCLDGWREASKRLGHTAALRRVWTC
jgi:hypothetical protein